MLLNFNHGFSKHNRIRFQRDFRELLYKGKILKGKYYTLRYLKNNLNFDRIGIIVKKYIGNAVRRNYEKRIIREFFRYQNFKSPGYDLSIVVRNTSGTFLDKMTEYSGFMKFVYSHDSQ